MDGYYLYWFFTPFSESRILRCVDSTHTVKTARYQGSDVLVCGEFSFDANQEKMYLTVTADGRIMEEKDYEG